MSNGRTRRQNPAGCVEPGTLGDMTVYLCRDPIDFRAGINGLSVLVEQTLKFDPFSRNLFGFINKRRNQIKVLYWQRSGFCLWQKRLEEERFRWPFHLDGPVVELTDEQFAWLLEGLDLKHLNPHRALEYRTVL
jgi:transposase